MRKLFTSESVTEGHPDKVCDRISDAVLDAVLAKDSEGRVACETCCTTDTVFIAGEITSKVDVDIEGIARRVLRDIGYTGGASGFDADTCKVMVSVHKQSPDIAMGTSDMVGGAGDQGMMFGYACNETPELMPLPIMLAHKMAYKLAQTRKDGTIPFILPDGKTQVTVEYEGDGKPQRIDTIVISTQHTDGSLPMLMHPLVENVITPVLQEARQHLPWLDIDTYDLYIPTAAGHSLAKTPQRLTAVQHTWLGILQRTSWHRVCATSVRSSWPMQSAWRSRYPCASTRSGPMWTRKSSAMR